MRSVPDTRVARGAARWPAKVIAGEAIGDQRFAYRWVREAVSPMLRAAPVTGDGPLMQSARAANEGDGKTVLDQEFGAATLSGLRQAVRQCASAAGLGSDRSIDVMIALHELAANVVRHGAGRGRLQMEVTAQSLRCQVSDLAGGTPAAGPPPEALPPLPWPVVHGHGMWLVRRTADQVQVATGADGSVVSVIFLLPAR